MDGQSELQAATAAMRATPLPAPAGDGRAGPQGGPGVPSSPFAPLSGGPRGSGPGAGAGRGAGGGARHVSASQARFSSSKSSRRLQT